MQETSGPKDGSVLDNRDANPPNILIYRVSHIRCSTARHESRCAARPRREQGKATLRRLAVVKTRKTVQSLFPVPAFGKNDVKLGRLGSVA
jgi:hypothetical protein